MNGGNEKILGCAAVFFLAIGVAACGSNGTGGAGSGAGGSGAGGSGAGGSGGASGYLATVFPIFEAKCVNCHWKGTPIGFQLQNPFDATTGMVGRATDWTMARNTILIAPGHPEQSFLVDKVQATDLNPDTEGAGMPLDPPLVTSTELTSIRTWIQNGANNDASFQTNVAPIFGDGVSVGAKAGKCSYCHSAQSLNPPNLANPFDTTRGVVNIAALVGGTRVIPGDPDHSVLYEKVSGAPLPAALKNPMPYQTPKLTTSEIAAIVAWIAGGALNN
jgi:hypothetical protein